MRWGVSDRATAAIVNAALIDYGIITPEDSSNVVDRQKIRRAKLKARTDLNRNFFQAEETLIGLFFDGKEIATLESIEEQGAKKTDQTPCSSHL